MSFRVKPFVLTAFAVLLYCAPAFSQMVFVQGTVKEADGKPVVGALVEFTGNDMANKITAKTDKKGHYVQSMKPAMFGVTVTVDGKVRFAQKQYAADGQDFNITLPPAPAAGASAPQLSAAPSAPSKGGSKDDDKAAKEREAQQAKQKELNDAFAAGRSAIDGKQWDDAITQLTKASELGPTQQAVWASLAEAYAGKAKSVKGDDAKAAYDKSFAAYDKLIELKPDDAGAYNNYALTMAADGKLDDARAKLAKAVEIDPPGAGKYHYNLGALLMNSGATDGAIDEFKKSIDADPNYAEAYYYYGSTLVGKATLDPSGKMVAPAGTVEALNKYLSLKPDGPNAQSAKDLIAALGSTVTVGYKDPNAPPAKSTTKKK